MVLKCFLRPVEPLFVLTKFAAQAEIAFWTFTDILLNTLSSVQTFLCTDT